MAMSLRFGDKARGRSTIPPGTLRSLVCGINRVFQSNKGPFSVLDKGDPRFRELLESMDFLGSELHKQGIGAVKKSAAVIDPKHEDLWWEQSLRGLSSPRVLQRTVFVYVGLHFALRGIQEQYNLVPSQLVRVPSSIRVYDHSVYYEYVEFISKNNQHRFKDINSTNKCVRFYAQPGSDRCLVKLLDKYLSLLPAGASHFYMRALDKFPSNPEKPCFVNQRVGVNQLKKVLTDLSVNSGISVRYTNHSLRATAITRMFNSGIVPEKVIAEVSGHRSMKALRFYERTSAEQQKAVGKVIANAGVQETLQTSAPQALMPATTTEMSSQSITKSSECKPTELHNLAHSFSGNFSNCTINIAK